VQFKKVWFQNFMSYREDALDSFNTPGLTLIEGENIDDGGSNGAGKSAPWDAISWCLFGQTVRGQKSDEVVNRDLKKDCAVTLELEHDGLKYKVMRDRKRSTGDPNSLRVHLDDGSEKQYGNMTDTQDWILKEFGIDFDLFRCTVIFAQGETFNFVDATNKKQKEILSKIMRINFVTFLGRTRDILKGKNVEVADYEKKIAILESHKVEDPGDLYRVEIEEWNDRHKKTLLGLKEEVKASKAEVERITSELKDTSKLEELGKKIQEKYDLLRSENKVISGKYASVKLLRSQERNKIYEIQELKGETECPKCFQKINHLDSCKFMKQCEAKMGRLDVLNEKLEGKISEIEASMYELDGKLERVKDEIRNQKHLKELFQSEEDLLNRLLKRAQDRKSETNPFVAKRDEELKKQKQIIFKLEELSVEIKAIKEELSYYEFWENAFGDAGIKSFVFDLICSTLTERSNYYASILTNNQVMIEFDTQTTLKTGETREKFEAAIITDGKKVPYHTYSGGEKRRISLSVDMALSDLMSDYYGSSFNVVVFDEQENYLDNQGREAYLNLLKEIAKKKRVFVVSHDTEFKSMFDDVIKIEKRGGFSKIVA